MLFRVLGFLAHNHITGSTYNWLALRDDTDRRILCLHRLWVGPAAYHTLDKTEEILMIFLENSATNNDILISFADLSCVRNPLGIKQGCS